MKTKKLIRWPLLLTVFTSVAICTGLVLLSPAGRIILDLVHINGNESAMRQPTVYVPVARRLALLCQSDQKLIPSQLTRAWLPKELNNLGYSYATLYPNAARIEMGGGFHHYGYVLSLDEGASDATTNVWQLYLYSESSDDNELLITLPLPKTSTLSPKDMLDIAETRAEELQLTHEGSAK